MAIAFGNTSGNGTQGTTTWSHNNDGNFVLVGINTTSDSISGITYDGDAMTQIGTTLFYSTIGRYFELWGIETAKTGANDIVVSGGANQNGCATSISDYGSNSGFNSGTDTATPAEITVTTTVDNAYVVAFGVAISYSSLTTGTTDVVGGVNGDPNLRMIRSTDAVSPAGADTIGVNMTGSELGAYVAVGINPVDSSFIPQIIMT